MARKVGQIIAQSGQNSLTENGSDLPVQHALIILEGFRAYSRSYSCLKPSVKVFVPGYLADARERLVDLTKALARKLDFFRNDPGTCKDIEDLSDVRSGL